MCGIAGLVSFDGAPIDRGVLRAMTDAVRHRGPDSAGYHVGPGIGLGHRRLSIIDLATGDQPISNEDGTVWTVFNGEIYNFADVRAQLEQAGHRFRTRTDSEVIVHGYEEWGEACVERFRGMFAFAVWDGAARRLLLARDRLGVKPLYYATFPDGGVIFGSEIKSLLADARVSRAWRPDALDAFLTLLYVPAPGTIYDAVAKLPAGHMLLADRSGIRTRQYWDLEFTGTGDASREDEYLEQLDALLRESVRLRLISDVPLGAFLSGGVDSSTVVAYMVETSDAPVITTSVGFDVQAYDELTHAETVARHLGCEFHPQIANPNIQDLLPTLAWHFDEPFADSSAVPTYYVSKAARSLVTVALSGDGGDELWAGYPSHRIEQLEQRARSWLGPGAGLVGSLAHALPRSLRAARALRRLALPPADAAVTKRLGAMFDLDAKRRLYTADLRRALAGADPLAPMRDAYASCRSTDPLDRALYADVKTYLVDDILTKVDRMSMAVSLETREPLLDHRLLEFVARVPSSLKLRQGRSKYLLRRLLERKVPRSIVERGKRGFEAPVGEWLRGPLAEMATDLLTDGRLAARGLFQQAEVERLWTEHRSGAADHRHRLWQLLMLELWFRQFADAAPAREAAGVVEVA